MALNSNKDVLFWTFTAHKLCQSRAGLRGHSHAKLPELVSRGCFKAKNMPKLVTRGHFQANLLKLVTRDGFLANLQKSATRGRFWAKLPKLFTRGHFRAKLPNQSQEVIHRLACPNWQYGDGWTDGCTEKCSVWPAWPQVKRTIKLFLPCLALISPRLSVFSVQVLLTMKISIPEDTMNKISFWSLLMLVNCFIVTVWGLLSCSALYILLEKKATKI